MVAQFIATRIIMDIYLKSERYPGARVTKWWWEQYGPQLEGSRGGEGTGRQRQRDRRS